MNAGVDQRHIASAPLALTYFSLSFPELTQTFVFNEMKRLRDIGTEVDVVAMRPPSGDISDLPYRYGFGDSIVYIDAASRPSRAHRFMAAARSTLSLLATGHGRHLARYLSERADRPRWRTLALAAQLARTQPAIVHCHFGTAGREIARLRALGLTGAKLTTVFHGYDLTQYLDGKPSETYRELFDEVDLMLPISDLWRQRLIELGADEQKVATVRLGIDCDAFEFRARGLAPGEPVRIISVGRMTEKKGHRYTIEAVANLAARRPDLDIRLDVVGNGPLLKQMREMVARLGIGNRIVLHGGLTNGEVRELLEQAHVFVLHSVTANDGDMEGIPVSIMEAMAMGLPVVSTRHSGIPELVADGVSGFLVEERDVATTAEAIERLADDPELVARMGREGRAIVERDYNAERQARRLHALLTSLTNSRGATTN
jgi:colanic acid/amylovoran biosynthesis glycosyltransferase